MLTNSYNIEQQGTFAAGGIAQFFFYFPDINGRLYDPSLITVTVLDPSGTVVVDAANVEQLEGHQYLYQWNPPEDSTTGLYKLTVNYTIESSSGSTTSSFVEEFVITAKGTLYLQPQAIAAVNFLEMFLGYTQRIPVFNQTGRFAKDRKTVIFHFPRWNQPAGTNIYVNGSLTDFDYEVDWLRGEVIFSKKLSQYDEVTADYNFRWFMFDELAQFIDQGVQVFNQYPPHSVYNIFSIPVRYGITVIDQAAVFALRRILLDLAYQEPVKVFGGAERADQVAQRLMSLKENYEKELLALLEVKKFGPYVGLHKQIITPEFTLPGGRCLSAKTVVKYRVFDTKNSISTFCKNSNVYTSPNVSNSLPASCVYTRGFLYDVFEQFSSGAQIEILSDKNGKQSFEPVSMIWESGEKPLLRITTEHGNYIDTTEEHIVFVNDEEIPAGSISIGDNLQIASDNGLIIRSKVASIKSRSKGKTFDLEVPSTRNLFANGIKCHNSRWFRYLFSTNA